MSVCGSVGTRSWEMSLFAPMVSRVMTLSSFLLIHASDNRNTCIGSPCHLYPNHVSPTSPLRRTKDFFKSVHLSGSGAAAEAAALREKEKADWESKVVVDSVKFLPHFGPHKPNQVSTAVMWESHRCGHDSALRLFVVLSCGFKKLAISAVDGYVSFLGCSLSLVCCFCAAGQA